MPAVRSRGSSTPPQVHQNGDPDRTQDRRGAHGPHDPGPGLRPHRGGHIGALRDLPSQDRAAILRERLLGRGLEVGLRHIPLESQGHLDGRWCREVEPEDLTEFLDRGGTTRGALEHTGEETGVEASVE